MRSVGHYRINFGEVFHNPAEKLYQTEKNSDSCYALCCRLFSVDLFSITSNLNHIIIYNQTQKFRLNPNWLVLLFSSEQFMILETT